MRYELSETAPSIDIDWASTYGEAVEKLSRVTAADPLYDLILTDINLPDGNGISLLSLLHERNLPICLVVITGLGDEDSAISALKAGAIDYIVKSDDYLIHMPATLESALNKFRKEIDRQIKPLHVFYYCQNKKDIDSIKNHFSVHSPHILVHILKSPEEIRKKIRENHGEDDNIHCDVLLLNYQYPDISAITLLKEIRSIKHIDLPVIIISNEKSRDTAVQVFRLGANDYVSKNPGYLYHLAGIIENAFHKVQLERERAALKASEEHFRMLIENSTDLIGVAGMDGIVTYTSPSIEKILGYKPDELLNNSFIDYLHPDDILEVESIMPALIKSAEKTFGPMVVRAKHKNNSWIYLELFGKKIADEHNREFFIINSRDITERKEVEQALVKSEERYRTLAENSSDMIWIMEINEAGRTISYLSPSVTRLIGYSVEEGKKLSVEELHPPSSAEIVFENIRKVIKSAKSGKKDEPESLEIQYIHKNGALIWAEAISKGLYDKSGNLIGILGVTRDISKRKLAEEALMESEIKYRSLVENSLVGVFIQQDGLFRFVNKRFCEIHGYSYEEIVDKARAMDFVHKDDAERLNYNLKNISSMQTPVEDELRIVKKDGTYANIKVFISLISYEGHPAAAGTMIDITRETNLENQLRHSQKMEAIGILAGGIAHDFNNILTVLTGYGSLLKMEEDKSLRDGYIEAILSSTDKATNLTKSLLAFARKQPISLNPANLNEIVKGTEKLLKRLLTEDITIKTIISSEDIIVMADPSQIDQILFNLAVNARDAMSSGGTITVETRLMNADRSFAEIHGFANPGRYAVLSVSDTGIGIEKNIRDHIFEPFFTTKEVGKGTGLGLSTVYGIVKQHNGYIFVYSEKDIGTTFHIYLPVTEPGIVEEKKTILPPGGTETILLAEDNEDVRHLMKDVLSQRGYRIIEAVDGEEAISRFNNNSEIDILILDSVMPKKNGRQVYDAINTIRPGMKAIFTSGYTSDVVFNKGIEDHKFDFVPKPISPETLLIKVREVLDR